MLNITPGSRWKNETGAYSALTPKTPGPIFASVGTVDTTPFTVGGGLSPHVSFDQDSAGGALLISGLTSHGSGGFFDLGSLQFYNRSRGTQAVPLALQNGDYIGGQVFGGYGSGDYNLGLTGMLAIATDDWDISPGALTLNFMMNAAVMFGTNSSSLTTAYYPWQFDNIVSLADGTAAAPYLNFTNDTNTGLYRPADDQVGITTGGVDRVIFGVGTTAAPLIDLANTDRTFTAASALIGYSNTTTVDFASATAPLGFGYGSTIIYNQNGGGFTSGFGFWMFPTLQNSSGSTRTMGPYISFASQPIYQANGGSLTVGFDINYIAQPTYNRINAGTTSVTAGAGYYSGGAQVGAGASVTTYYDFLAIDSANSGTFTTHVGLGLAAMTVATNNTSILIGASAATGNWGIYQSTTTQNYLAGKLGLNTTTVNASAQLQINGSVYFDKETARTIKVEDTVTAATAGAALSILGAHGSPTTSGAGGAISVTAGNGQAGNAAGGTVSIAGGLSSGIGTGGHINIDGGDGFVDGNIRLGSSKGKVGIGSTTAPSGMLHIFGKIASTPTLYVDNGAISASVAEFYDNASLVWSIADGGNLTAGEGINIVTGTTTGTKIGTATTQKLGLWNATPIVQPTTAVTAATFVANTSGIVDDSATFDGYTIGQIVKALRNIGALA